MQNPTEPESQNTGSPNQKKDYQKAIWKSDVTQLSVQLRFLSGNRHAWPYAQLCYHTLRGGVITIVFSEHIVTIRGRHLQDADDGLRLQSLVWLEETGTRRKKMLGEEEIPEDQPAIDSIEIEERERG